MIQLIMKVLVKLSIGSWKMKMILFTFVIMRYKILTKRQAMRLRLRLRLDAQKLESLIDVDDFGENAF